MPITLKAQFSVRWVLLQEDTLHIEIRGSGTQAAPFREVELWRVHPR
jgi:hypothetical protein